MAEEASDQLLTLDEAYRAAYHFIHQYYERERITPFMLLLHSMRFDSGGGGTNDPATWHDWQIGRAHV